MSRASSASRSFPVCALLAVLPALSARADDEGAKPFSGVLVTATRLPETQTTVGSPVTVTEGDALEQAQVRTLADALRETPGLTVMRLGGPGQQTSIFLRGSNSDHTLLRMDGVRVMDAASPAGAAAWDNLLAADIGRLEVLPGPQSPLYGSGAIGGVVAATTPRGEGAPNGAVSAEAGSRYTFIERAHAGGGDDTFNWYAGVARHDTRGFSAQRPDTERDGYANTSFALRLGFGITDIFGIDVVARGTDAKTDIDEGANLDISTLDTGMGYVKIAPHLTLAEGRWEQVLNLSTFGIRRTTRGADTMFTTYPSKYRSYNLDADWQNTFHVCRELDLVGGLEALREVARGDASASTFDASARTYAAYAQARIAPVERVTLNLGGRVDHHSAFGTRATWRGAAAYDLAETNAILRGSAGTAFKAPTLAELYDGTFGSNNANLRPERSFGWDAGVDQRFFGQGDKAQLTLSGTYFENRVRDEIVAVPTPPASFNFVNQNVDEAVARGVEAAAAWKALQGADGALTTTATYTYTDSRATGTPATFGTAAGRQLLRRPWNQATLRVEYALPHDAASFGVAVHYLGNRRDLDPNTFATVNARSRTTVDLTVRAKIHGPVSAFGRVENLFNCRQPEVLGYNPTPFGAFGGVEVKF